MSGLVPVAECTSAAEVMALARAAHDRMRAYDRRIISPATGFVRRVKIVEKPAAPAPVVEAEEKPVEQAPVSVEAFRRAADVIAAEALLLAGRKTPPANWIAARVAASYGVDVKEVLSHRRRADLVLIRQKIFWLVMSMTTLSYIETGRIFKGRDHTTIMYGVRKMSRLLAEECPSVADLEPMRVALESEWVAAKAPVTLTEQEGEQ